jgi:hypothetical protein
MMKVESIPYKREHIVPLVYQSANLGVKKFFLSDIGEQLESNDSVTITINEKVMCCGGIMEMWAKRGHIWCVFNEESKSNFVPVFRAIKKFLEEKQEKYPRIEVSIPYDMRFAKRRAELLGFKCEIECAKKYLPDGTDCAVYVLIKGDK